jgi:hypothetical protein
MEIFLSLLTIGCGSSTAQTLAVTVINNVPPQPAAISGNNSVCQNSSQTYSINSVPGATSYTWALPSGWMGSSATSTINATVALNNGNILVKANNSCGSSPPQTLAVSVDVAPGQLSSITGNNAAMTGQTITYSINPVNGATGYFWSINGGGSITSGQNTNSITIHWQTAGNYMLTVNASNNCGTSADQTIAVSVSITTGVSNPVNPFEIKVLPNPSSSKFYLKAKGVQHKIIKVEIMNMLGQAVYYSAEMTGTNDYSYLINLNKVAQGLYIIKISIDDTVYTRRIVKSE